MKIILTTLLLFISFFCFSQKKKTLSLKRDKVVIVHDTIIINDCEKKFKAFCIKHCYDGDSPELIVNLHENIYVVDLVRMYGIDTPEMHGKDSVRAKKAQKVLDSIIYMKELIFVPSKGGDKYGRLLGTLYLGKLNINEYMLKYANAYFGGKKEEF